MNCSSNEEVFGHIKSLFDVALRDEAFIDKNGKENFTDKKRNIKPYQKLDTSTAKLRNQMKTLKKEWRNITDKIKNGSGLAPEKEPDWYLFLNLQLAETKREINVTSGALQTSFVDDVEESEGDECPNEEDLIPDEDESGDEGEKRRDLGRPNKKKLVTAVHKKRNQIRSNKQALTEVAKAMQNMAKSQVKSMKMTLDTEEKREERRRKYQLQEAERNRNHELNITKIYATAFVSIQQTANHYQLLPFHASQKTVIQMRSPTELNSPGLTPPYSLTPQSNHCYGFVNKLNDESHPNMALFKARQAKKQQQKKTIKLYILRRELQ